MWVYLLNKIAIHFHATFYDTGAGGTFVGQNTHTTEMTRQRIFQDFEFWGVNIESWGFNNYWITFVTIHAAV